MKAPFSIAVALWMCVAQPSLSQEQPSLSREMTGWCFPGGGCSGPEPITASGFHTCEESCVLKNPVIVEGLNGTLFDVECSGDTGNYNHRMLLMTYADHDGEERALAVLPDGPEQLEKCD